MTGARRLTARERARRAARGGSSRSAPVPLLVPALVAVAFLVLPLAGLLIRAPWSGLAAALSGADATQALQLSLWTATTATEAAANLTVSRRRGLQGRTPLTGMNVSVSRLPRLPGSCAIG